jgi:NitT/TauT family transport system substrate-binding protein
LWIYLGIKILVPSGLLKTVAGIVLLVVLFFTTSLLAVTPPKALEPVTVGMLKFGTARWEMQVIKDHKLDEKFGIDLKLMDVASKQASHVAIMAGEADIVLSDFLWVAVLRGQGDGFTLVPHSYAVGGLIVPANSAISSLTDLPGKTIGVAGGPVDKSWVTLQAYYLQQTGDTLADKVNARFGAPPLINELLAEGQIDASLNFWHWNARAKADGNVELVSVASMMDEMGISPKPPLLGWVFRNSVAEDRPQAIKGFMDASFAAKNLLLNDDSVWKILRGKMRATDNDVLFEKLRDDYRAGILTSYDEETIVAAAALFAIMAEIGGEDLVGKSKTMDPGTFWDG